VNSKNKLILLLMISLVFGCADTPRPLWSTSVESNIWGGSWLSDKTIIISKNGLYKVGYKSINKPIDLPDKDLNVIECGSEKCWYGSGRNINAFIGILNLENSKNDILRAKNVEIYDIKYHKDSSKLVSADGDGSISIWDPNSLLKLENIALSDSEINSLLVLNDFIFAGDNKGHLFKIDNSKKGKMVRKDISKAAIYWLGDVSGSIWAATSSGNLISLDKKGLEINKTYNLGDEAILGCDHTVDNDYIFCGLTNGIIAVINLRKESKKVLKVDSSDIRYIKVLNENNYLVTASKKGVVSYWSMDSLITR